MKAVLDEYTGILGIGYLFGIGIFFIADSFYRFHDYVNTVVERATWPILATIPLIILAYIFGLIIVQISELVIPKLFFPTVQDKFRHSLSFVIKTDSELLNNRYQDIIKNRQLLNSGVIAFTTVGIGSGLDGSSYEGVAPIFGFIGLIGSVVIGIICPIISAKMQEKFLEDIEYMKIDNVVNQE